MVEELEQKLTDIRNEQEPDFFDNRSEYMSGQLSYFSDMFWFVEQIDLFDGDLDRLHRYLISDSRYAAESFRRSVSTVSGILRKFGDILSDSEILTELNDSVEIVFFDEEKFNKTTIMEVLKEYNQNFPMGMDIFTEYFGRLSVDEAYDIYYERNIDLLYEAADALTYIADEYERRVTDDNYSSDGGLPADDEELTTLLGIVILLVSGGLLIGHDIATSNPVTVCVGFGLLAKAATVWPGVDNLDTWPFNKNKNI